MNDQLVRRRSRHSAGRVRSVRVSDPIWDAARTRAEKEGDYTMSFVVGLLVEGYAKGLINLPQVQLVFDEDQPKSA